MRFWLTLSFLGVLALPSGAVRAEPHRPTRPPVPVHKLPAADRERARGLLDEGDAKMAAGDVEGALAAYVAADELVHVPTSGIEVGRAQAALGHWIEARDAWIRVARYPKRPDEPEPFTRARKEAERLAVEIAERIPTLRIDIEPSELTESELEGLELFLDDEPLARDLLGVSFRANPGVHQVSVSVPDYLPVEELVTLTQRSARTVTLTLRRRPEPARAPRETSPSAAPRPSAVPMWLGFGVAAAGAGVGTATGIWAYDAAAAAYAQCGGTSCAEEDRAAVERAQRAGMISTVAFAVGGVGLVVGIWQAVVQLNHRGQVSQTAHRTAAPRSGSKFLVDQVALVPSGGGAQIVLGGLLP